MRSAKHVHFFKGDSIGAYMYMFYNVDKNKNFNTFITRILILLCNLQGVPKVTVETIQKKYKKRGAKKRKGKGR